MTLDDIARMAGMTIEQLHATTILRLDYKRITDISPLAGLNNLTQLWLHNNRITDLSPLAGLTNLTDLWLDRNQITDLSPLAGLTGLTQLWLINNPITDLSPIVPLANPYTVLVNGKLADLTGLVEPHDVKLKTLYTDNIDPRSVKLMRDAGCRVNPW